MRKVDWDAVIRQAARDFYASPFTERDRAMRPDEYANYDKWAYSVLGYLPLDGRPDGDQEFFSCLDDLHADPDKVNFDNKTYTNFGSTDTHRIGAIEGQVCPACSLVYTGNPCPRCTKRLEHSENG